MNVSRAALVAGVAASSVVLLAGPAFAHVSVQPQGEAAKGGYATVNFKVPNERDNASTVKLEVTLPTDTPMASVLPQPVPGWTVKVDKAKLAKPLDVHGKQITEAPSKITWTATSSKIGPGEFQQFPVSLGQLPENADQLVFKALQTYDNKEVVRWIEEPKEGGEEPETPAPVLELSAATGDHHGGGAANQDKAEKDGEQGAEDTKEAGHDDGGKHDTASAESSSEGSSSDTTARVLGIVGIVIGAAGVAFGVLARRRRSV